jgi:membrane associated rhomboid family serine protease
MLDDLKFKIKKGDALVRVIMINFFIFIPLLILSIGMRLTGHIDLFHNIVLFFELPSDPILMLYRPWTLILYGFSHYDVLHFLGNMLGLYWLGGIIQEFLGEKRFMNIYLLGAVFGGLLYMVFYNIFPIFNGRPGLLIGASGAVYALGAAAITLLPDYTVYITFLGDVKLKYIVGIYLLLSFANIAGPNAGGAIAHLGGGLLGFTYIKILKQGYDMGSPIQKTWSWLSGLFVKKSKLRITYKNLEHVSAEYPDQEEIDRILDKMNQKGGYNALSKEEKEKLFKYSQK